MHLEPGCTAYLNLTSLVTLALHFAIYITFTYIGMQYVIVIIYIGIQSWSRGGE